MRILAIETSCDETAICLADVREVAGKREFRILANETVSQIAMHQEYGGVFPTVAKREHARVLAPLLHTVLQKTSLIKNRNTPISEEISARVKKLLDREYELLTTFKSLLYPLENPGIDRIVVTSGPGLEPALWVGINFAQALGVLWGIPVSGANHMEGHILAALFSTQGEIGHITPITFPAIALLVSGGHTELVLVKDWGVYELLGETKDDAVGEAFDKVARMLGLPYPGGPEISRIAQNGTPGIYPLPRPMIHSGDLHFSFSGLKTAVLYLVKKLGVLTDQMKADIAYAFEASVTEVIAAKTKKAILDAEAQTLIVGGGVSANARIRNELSLLADELGVTLCLPGKDNSTDNALMIALVGALKPMDDARSVGPIIANGNWKIHA